MILTCFHLIFPFFSIPLCGSNGIVEATAQSGSKERTERGEEVLFEMIKVVIYLFY